MGQYYVPVILDEDGKITYAMTSWDFNSGAKLMEHSWLKNDFVNAFETLLVGEAPRRVVWAGDYADNEEGQNDNLYFISEAVERYRPDVSGLGEQGNYVGGQWITTIDPEIKPNAFPVIIPRLEAYPFLINWDKKQYVDKRKVPSEGWAIHPLPLLTVEGNGRGGGDFDVEDGLGNVALVGTWARDHISLSNTVPHGFDEVEFDLAEKRFQNILT